jgi:hypothetical protein
MPSTKVTFLISATTGGGAGALFGFIANRLASIWTRWKLHKKLLFISQQPIGARTSARIYNSYVLPLNSVYAYISIEHKNSDVLASPDHRVPFIRPEHLGTVREDRLCWSISPNPPCVDIYAGEKQSLDLGEFNNPKWILIPSECGWENPRVFLKVRKYNATIKIISKDTKAKEFKIEIDPHNHLNPVTLSK